MARINEQRWQYNEAEGNWTRKVGGVQETTAIDPTGQPDEDTAEGPNATDGALQAAQELGVDLATIEGTGADGRITKADVEAAHAETASA